MSILKIWYLAIRPKTLPAAAGPVIVGTGLAIGDGVFQFAPAFAALLGALLLQIGSNLANDVYDYKKGTDTKERTGPLRVTQAGLLSPRQVIWGMWCVFASSALIGLYLSYIGGWPILVIGILAIISAIIYTAGPYPLGYNGVADIFVFVFFGPVAVCGTYYVQAEYVSPSAVWASLPAGFLVTAILVVNNLRDIETDRKAGKKTLAVRWGLKFTQVQYVLLLGVSYLVPIMMYIIGITSSAIFISWLSLPLIIPLVRDVFTKRGVPLNGTLAGTARLGLIFNVLISASYIIGKVIS